MSSEICIMCKQDIDDPIQFGEKITFEDVTAHYFCLVCVPKFMSFFVAKKDFFLIIRYEFVQLSFEP